MAVPIKFEADLTEVRAALDRLIAEARATPVAIGGSGGGNNGFAGGIASLQPAPTVQGVFGASAGTGRPPSLSELGQLFGINLSNGTVSGGAPSAANTFGFPGSASTALGSGPTVSNTPQGATVISPPPAQSSQAATAQILGPAGNGFAGNVTQGGAGGGGGGNGFGSGFLTRGFGRLIGAGYALRAAEQIVGAERQYNIDSTLAGSDQAAQTSATLSLRQGLVGSVPLIGTLINEIDDPGGVGEIGIRSTLAAAAAQERGIDLRRSFAAGSRRLRDEINEAGLDNSFERASARLEAEHRERGLSITERGNAIGDADRKRIDEDEKQRNASRQSRASEEIAAGRAVVTPGKTTFDSGYDATYNAIEQKDRSAIARQRGESAANIERTLTAERGAESQRFALETAAIARERYRADAITQSRFAGEGAVADASALGVTDRTAGRIKLENEIQQTRLKVGLDPNISFANKVEAYTATGKILDADARERQREVVGEGAERVRNEVRQNDSVAVQKLENEAAKARISSQPIEALLKENEANRERALAGIDRFQNSNQYNATRDAFDLRKTEILHDDDLSRSRRQTALYAQGEILDIELKGGRYGATAAQSAEIRYRALGRAQQLSDDDPVGNRNEIQKVLENATKEEDLATRNFLLNFKPQEVGNIANLSSSNFQGGGQNEVVETLKGIAADIAAIKAASDYWGRAQ